MNKNDNFELEKILITERIVNKICETIKSSLAVCLPFVIGIGGTGVYQLNQVNDHFATIAHDTKVIARETDKIEDAYQRFNSIQYGNHQFILPNHLSQRTLLPPQVPDYPPTQTTIIEQREASAPAPANSYNQRLDSMQYGNSKLIIPERSSKP